MGLLGYKSLITKLLGASSIFSPNKKCSSLRRKFQTLSIKNLFSHSIYRGSCNDIFHFIEISENERKKIMKTLFNNCSIQMKQKLECGQKSRMKGQKHFKFVFINFSNGI